MTDSEFAEKLRLLILDLSNKFETAHLGSALSCTDLLASLFNSQLENYTKQNFGNTNDFFILSKGHAALALYSALHLKDFLTLQELNTFTLKGSYLEEHPNPDIPGVEVASGSLGHGLAVGSGIAMGQKILGTERKVFVLMSDGECNEGTVWESAMFASANKLSNLICLVDLNGWQATGRTTETFGEIEIAELFEAFRWKTYAIDGHNFELINACIGEAKKSKIPTAIICKTIKGKGVDFMEDDNNWHYKSPNVTELKQALSQVRKDIK
jgi:transketolase